MPKSTCPAFHHRGDRRGHAVEDADRDAGIRLGQFLDRARQQPGGHRWQRGDRDETAPMREQLFGARGDRFDVDEDALERHEQIAAGLGERDVPLVAIEQLHADRALELLNLHGQRGLRHVQLGRGAREAAGAGEREKCADVAKVVDHGRQICYYFR